MGLQDPHEPPSPSLASACDLCQGARPGQGRSTTPTAEQATTGRTKTKSTPPQHRRGQAPPDVPPAPPRTRARQTHTGPAVSPSHQRLWCGSGSSAVWGAVRPGSRGRAQSCGERRTHRPWGPASGASHDPTQPNPTQPPLFCETNAFGKTTVGVVSATFGTPSHFALCSPAPPLVRTTSWLRRYWALSVVLARRRGGGGHGNTERQVVGA